jgi:hypothetical protein
MSVAARSTISEKPDHSDPPCSCGACASVASRLLDFGEHLHRQVAHLLRLPFRILRFQLRHALVNLQPVRSRNFVSRRDRFLEPFADAFIRGILFGQPLQQPDRRVVLLLGDQAIRFFTILLELLFAFVRILVSRDGGHPLRD